MSKSVLWVLGILCLGALLAPVQAGEVAIYTGNVGWIDKVSADAQATICRDNLTAAGLTVTWFANGADDAALATWVTDHTGDDQLDVLVLYGFLPTSLYAAGNTQANGSVVENFIETTDGDMVLNHADYMFYVTNPCCNGDAALRTIMDLTDIAMWDDNTVIAVTTAGSAISPTLAALNPTQTDRPFHFNELAGGWYVEASLAQNGAGTRGDPAIVRYGDRGRLAIAFQTPDNANLPRGDVAAEMITYIIDKAPAQLAIAGPATTVEGTPVRYTVQLQDDLGTLTAGGAVTVNLASSSGTGRFDTSRKGAFNGTVTSVAIPAGGVTANFYYKDTAAGGATLTASAAGLASGTITVNILQDDGGTPGAAPGEVAIYTGSTGWIDKALADEQAQICAGRLDLLGITNDWFNDAAQELDVATWVTDRTNNGKLDVLIIYGWIPTTLYAAGNTEPDGSLVETFIESTDGDTVINHADYMFYVSNPINGQVALENIMDIPGMNMWDDHVVAVTQDGREITPTLADYQSQVYNGLYYWTNRPFHADQLINDWFVEAALGENPAGTRMDPVVVRDGNRGRLVPALQAANRNDPKGAVATEIVAWLHGINLGNPIKLAVLGRTSIMVTQPLGLTAQVQNFLGGPAPVTADRTVTLQSSSATGRFDTSVTGAFDGSVTSVLIPAGNASASFYYKDSTPGTPTITVTSAGLTSGTLQVNVLARSFAPAGEVAIYTGNVNPDWTPMAMAVAEAAICQERLENVGVTVDLFDTVNPGADELALWMSNHMDNGKLDVVVLFGAFPNAIYPVGNTSPNFSTAESFIETTDGDTILNLGDWMFYCDYDAANVRTDNGPGGLQNMMDVPAVTMAGFDNAPMTVTTEGKAIAPSLIDFLTDRPLHLDTLGGNWIVEAVLAQSADGILAEPVIIRDGNKGRLIAAFQTANQATDPKGAVAAEIIGWLLQKSLPRQLTLASVDRATLTGRPTQLTVNVVAGDAVTVSLGSSAATGRFDTAKDGPFNGSVTSVSIPAGGSSATFYYKDTAAGTVTLTANAAGLQGAALVLNVLEDVSVAMGEVAIYTGNVGWIDKAVADAQAQICVDALTAAGITTELYDSDADVDAVAAWVGNHTDNGALDVLILYGFFPQSLYPAPNLECDASIAELFIETTDGDVILNHADYMFYVDDVARATDNAAGGLQCMMDIPGITMWDDRTAVTVTAEGTAIAPTLVDFTTDRPFHINELAGNWWVEASLAQNAAGTRADPIIVRDGNLGRLIPVYQTNAPTYPENANDPKGQVAAEIIIWLKSKTSGVTENCTNGVDDDGDTKIDCADTDCASAPICQKKQFHRGDPNNDGAINITDGIYILNYLFLGGPKPTCLESANPNDDASINITDGIYVLNYLFLGGPPPVAPGPVAQPCGPDREGSPTDLGCETYTKC